MAIYLTGFLVTACITGVWIWTVARYGGVRFPTADLLLTVALCSAVGALPRVGWLLATIILVTVSLRVEQAEPWPETVILAAGPMVVWFIAGTVVWSMV